MANYSLGEIDSLARKATRGAGYNWGIAEEAGKSVRWLSAYGFLGAEILAQYLSTVADKSQTFIPKLNNQASENIVFETQNSQLCSLFAGTLINDLGHQLRDNKTLCFKNVLSPLLALSQAGRVAEAYGINISFLFDDKEIVCSADGIYVNSIHLKDTPPLLADLFQDSVISNNCSDVKCSRIETTLDNTHFPSPYSRPISVNALKVLEQFAHATYAPATEESRLKGAG